MDSSAIVIEHAQVDEINVSAVKNNDFARFNSGADFRGANTIGCLCRFDQNKVVVPTATEALGIFTGGTTSKLRSAVL